MNREHKIYQVTLAGSIVNFLLVVFKFFAGIVGRSSAMIADAVHSLSDFVSDIVVLLFVRISGKPQDADHDYGHGKYETLAAVIIGLMLGVVGFGIMYNGVSAVYGVYACGELLAPPNYWALSAAALSIMLKEAMYWYTVVWGQRLDSAALRANAWHHRSDAFTSVATLIGIGGAMVLGERWRILDPLAAVVVSVFIIVAAYRLMKPGIDELLEKSLGDVEKRQITEILTQTPGVVRIHRLCTRRIGTRAAIEVHLKMDANLRLKDAHDIASEAERRLRAEFGPQTHISIHMEPVDLP